MVAMPIHDTVKPSVLSNFSNGAIPDSELSVVDREGYTWKMAILPARGMRALHAAIKERFGVQMTSVGRGRSFKEQYDLFLVRHTQVTLATYLATPKIAGVANKRTWTDAPKYGYGMYWILKKGYASAAVPGTSPHGWSCADDMALPDDADADTYPEGISDRLDILNWMYENEHLYGFAHSLTSEPWHVQWIMGDTIPLAVVVYEKSLEQKPVPVTPEVPVVVPPALDSGLMIVRYKLVDANAEFLAIAVKLTDGRVVALWVEWTGSGDDPKVQKRLANLAGIATPMTASVGDFSTCTLFGPLPVDGAYNWTGDEFARVIS